ncbi:MAG: 50S ribosomal protein L10 [Rickettsiaceae bacterium]|nr:50S ribosomal protein L10 [Rickettsiaceae bacterium]
MNRAEKINSVAELENIYKKNSFIVVTHYHGLTVSQMNNLRNSLINEGAGYKIVKNTISKIAAEKAGINGAGNLFKGPVAIVYSEEPVSSAKVVAKFAKENDALKISGGFLDKEPVDSELVLKLSNLPSLMELRSKIVGVISAVPSKIVSLTNAPASKLARVINEYSKK